MEGKDLQKLAKKIMSTAKAGRDSDPYFYQGLEVLPNPDPILRAMGKADEVYDAIMSDAHVLGELRSIEAGLNAHKFRVKPGVNSLDTPQEERAKDLCELWLSKDPAPRMTWPDVIWNMGSAVLTGFRVHELIWDNTPDGVFPTALLDRPNRRFLFSPDNALRLLTKREPTNGEPTEDPYFLLSRHMPSQTNPYGRAILSACFWPYTFKKGGFKFFYQFCERYGLPFPIGKYPAGTDLKGQQDLLDALVQLLQDGAAAVPDDASVELLTSSHSGELAQEAMVHLCNREMSKAITSQTLATENQGVGSNAASKTHYERQSDNSSANRKAVAASLNQVFRWITYYNVGEDVVAPVFEFYKDKDPTIERAEQYEIVARLSNRVPLKALHEEMNIPIAEGDEEVIVQSAPVSTATPEPKQFSACSHCGRSHEFSEPRSQVSLISTAIREADKVIESNLIDPIEQMLREYESSGKTLKEFYSDIEKLGLKMDQNKLAEINEKVMRLAFAQGMEEEQ
ncbi:MAG: hypothetical protein C9356_12340 [Oleiphilus sp.]|nr:MAG: hypothetical protein C9356_12340 [Oleiphilus sp.]